MQHPGFSRQYVILRPVQGSMGGFARLETRSGGGSITLQITQAPDIPLRALMLCGDSGVVIDLGLLTSTGRRHAALHRCDLPFPALHCHALAVCADWPESRLLLYGWLTASPACTLWQLQESAAHYLALPAGDTPLPEPQPLPEAAPRARIHASLLRLPPLTWPEPLSDLRCYFSELPPFAPFDAPGWRFVQVHLERHAPAAWCAVGIRIRGRRITGAAYALPGHADQPLQGLHGYRWTQGRHGQGYWLTTTDADGQPAREVDLARS